MQTQWQPAGYVNGHYSTWISGGSNADRLQVSVGGHWYYLNADGAMATGWVYVNGHYYYMDQWGAMTTGWVQVGNDWYYMNSDGTMATNQWIGGYYVGASGKME